MRSTFTQVSASTDYRMLPGFHALSAIATALSRKRSAAVYLPCSVISPATNQVIGEGILPEFSNYNPAWTYVTLGASDTKPFAQLSNVQSAQAWHVARRLWYWQANGQQRITLVLDQGGWATPRATDMLWWLSGLVAENYRQNRSPMQNMGSYGTRTLKSLASEYLNKDFRILAATTDIKWWPFNLQFWQITPQLLSPDQITAGLAAYYLMFIHHKVNLNNINQYSKAFIKGKSSLMGRLIMKSLASKQEAAASPLNLHINQVTPADVVPLKDRKALIRSL